MNSRPFFQRLISQTVRLEEVELSEDDKHWSITFSFRTFPKSGATISEGLFSSERQYKTVRLDAETGEVKSIKIRVLA